jgi:hypothetical protein
MIFIKSAPANAYSHPLTDLGDSIGRLSQLSRQGGRQQSVAEAARHQDHPRGQHTRSGDKSGLDPLLEEYELDAPHILHGGKRTVEIANNKIEVLATVT